MLLNTYRRKHIRTHTPRSSTPRAPRRARATPPARAWCTAVAPSRQRQAVHPFPPSQQPRTPPTQHSLSRDPRGGAYRAEGRRSAARAGRARHTPVGRRGACAAHPRGTPGCTCATSVARALVGGAERGCLGSHHRASRPVLGSLRREHYGNMASHISLRVWYEKYDACACRKEDLPETAWSETAVGEL